MHHAITLRRVYEEPLHDKSVKILVDRLRPRGFSHESAYRNHRIKEVGPTTKLRQRFNHEPTKRDKFKICYTKELQDNIAVEKVKKIRKKHDITLLYGAKNIIHNQVIVLRDFLKHNSKTII